MGNLSDFLNGIPVIGGTINSIVNPSAGYDTAAQGAKNAQAQANQLSALQWNRQMAGLTGALGFTNSLQQLYNSLYGPGGGRAAAGGNTPMQAQPALQPGGANYATPNAPPKSPLADVGSLMPWDPASLARARAAAGK